MRFSSKAVRAFVALALTAFPILVVARPAYAATPTITSLTPAAGSTAGGRSVTITGTNFVDVSAVKFGTAFATEVVTNSSTSITLNTPAYATVGSVAVQVFTMSGQSNTTVTYEYFTPAFYAIDNGFLRFGNGNQSSFATNGVLEQPWYKYNGSYGKLTIGTNALNLALGSGTGSVNWTGSNISEVTSALTNFSINSAGFVGTGKSVSGGGEVGYGTIETSGDFILNSQTLNLSTKYYLGKGKAYIEVTTKVTNKSATNVQNLNYWVGTRDDWVGNTDGPTKERGNVANGSFSTVATTGAQSNALRVTSSAEGALFFSTSPGANTAVNYCCSFSNAYNQNPQTDDTTWTGDGSYAMTLKSDSVAPNGSIDLTWYYAAGATADLNTIANQIYVASTAPSAPTITTTSSTTSSINVNFTAPSSTGGGGATITNYEFSTDGGTNWVTRSPASTASPLVISGLTDETVFRIQIRAVNSVPLSGAASSVVNVTTAGQPPSFTVTPSATLQGTSPFTYTVTASEIVTGLSLSDFNISGSGCQIDSLSGTGKNYLVTVSGCSNGSTANLTLNANAVQDLAGNNGPTANVTAASVSVDTTPPTNSVAPTISGSMIEGSSLTGERGVWAGPELSYTWQWQSASTANGTYSSISGATSSSYTLTSTEVGKYIRLAVTATNLNGSAMSTSSPSTKVLAIPTAPAILNAYTLSGGISVKFTPSSNAAAAGVTKYQYTTDNGSSWADLNGLVSPQLISLTSSGLSLNAANLYSFKIRATNELANSTASSSITTYYLSTSSFSSSSVTFGGSPKATINSSNNQVTLTTASGNQFGSVWGNSRIDVTKDFVINASVYLGNSDAGADGLAFVIQPASTAAGSSGGGLGYAGINNSFAVEFDTYYNGSNDPTSSDHIAYVANGAPSSSSAQTAYVTPYSGELEDGTWRDVRFIWNATSKTFTTELETTDGSVVSQILSATVDIRALVGNDFAYWGFTAATGGSVNLQQVKIDSYAAIGRPNTAPTLSAISDATVLPAASANNFSLVFSDENSTLDQLSVTATSSDQNVIANSGISVSSKTLTGATLAITPRNVSGTTTITVNVMDADGTVATRTFDLTVFGPAAQPPAFTLSASDQTLVATFDDIPSADLGGGSLTRYEYKVGSDGWTSLGTTKTFTLSGLTNNSSYSVKVRAVTTRGANTQYGNEATLSGTPNIPPALVAAPTISGSARYGQTFTATSGSWSGLGTSSVYQWQRSATGDESGSWENIGSSSSTYITGTSDLGKYIRVRVTTSNSAGSVQSASFASTEILDQPATIVNDPTITGTTTVDSILTVNAGTWNGTRNNYTYQWYRAGVNGGANVAIPGATNSTYTLTEADGGRRIYVVETARNTYSINGVDALSSPTVFVAKNTQTVSNFTITGTKSFSEQTRVVTGDNDRNLVLEFISSTPEVCSTSTATRVSATSTSTISYLSAGTCTITAKHPGNSGYLASNEISQSFEIQPSAPSAVRNQSASVSDTKITTNWTAPLNTGGSPIASYLVTATSGSTTLTCTSTTTSCAFEALTQGATYEITITPTNTAVGASQALSGPSSSALRALIPAAQTSTTTGNIPARITPKPPTTFLGAIPPATQTALINSGVIAPPPAVPVANVTADLSTGSINTPTTVVVNKTVESGSEIDLAVIPPADTPIGTPVYGTLILAEGKTYDLGQIAVTTGNLVTGIGPNAFTILPVGMHYVELRFGQAVTSQAISPAIFTPASFGFAPLSFSEPIFRTASSGAQINIRFEINIVAGPNGVPKVTKSASPTPSSSTSIGPSPSASSENTPTPSPSTETLAEPAPVIDPRGLEVVNPVLDAPAEVAQTTLTAVTLVAAVTAAASAATAVAAAAGAAASAGAAAAAGGAAGSAAGGASGSSGSASRSAGGASGGSSSGGSGSSSSNSGGSSGGSDPNSEEEGEGSVANIDFEHDGFEVEHIAWGDGLKIWSSPVATLLDKPSHNATGALAPVTPLVSKLISDGAYLRAIFGVLAALLPALGIALGVIGVYQAGNQLLPPSAFIVTVIAAIGVFDAFAGFLAMAVFALGMQLTVGIHTAGDLRMMAGLFIIGFGPALLAGAFRGLRKAKTENFSGLWERLVDLAVAPFMGGWATKGMVEALPALAGVKLPLADYSVEIAWVVAIGLVIRVLLEEFTAHFFPSRLNFIHPADISGPHNVQKVIALTMRAGIFWFVAGAFIGTSWHLYVGTFLFIAPSYLALIQDRFPNYPKLYQILPAGLPGLAFTLLVASYSLAGLTAVLGETPDLAKLAFVFLPIPSVILSILGMLGREPADGDVRWYQRENLTWLYRIGGVLVLIYTMRLTGIL